MSSRTEAQVAGYELEIAIAAPPEAVWKALTTSTDSWWLGDFRTLGPESKVTFDARAGGGLVESTDDGASLLWYTVQMVIPGESLHLIGHSAPAWGGPTLTMLELRLEARDGGTVLAVSDALVGKVSDAQAESLRDGWQQLFGDGLKRFVER